MILSIVFVLYSACSNKNQLNDSDISTLSNDEIVKDCDDASKCLNATSSHKEKVPAVNYKHATHVKENQKKQLVKTEINEHNPATYYTNPITPNNSNEDLSNINEHSTKKTSEDDSDVTSDNIEDERYMRTSNAIEFKVNPKHSFTTLHEKTHFNYNNGAPKVVVDVNLQIVDNASAEYRALCDERNKQLCIELLKIYINFLSKPAHATNMAKPVIN
ncbi:hypothetical protein COBT_000153 [Conglomerata obtusa]